VPEVRPEVHVDGSSAATSEQQAWTAATPVPLPGLLKGLLEPEEPSRSPG